MAERLRFKSEEIESVLETVLKKLKECKNISSFSLTAKDLFADKKDEFKDLVKPIILIPSDIYCKMFELVEQSPVEISWHGLVHRDIENQTYEIYDILVFPQINSATSTTTDEEDFADWMTELVLDPNFPIQDLRFHGHSHVNMSVFSSAVDDAYQQDILTKVDEGDYYLFLVLNKKHDICALLYDCAQQILFTTHDLEIRITNPDRTDIKKWAMEQISEYCEEEKPRYNYGTYRGYQQKLEIEAYNNETEVFIKDSKVAPQKNHKKGKNSWT